MTRKLFGDYEFETIVEQEEDTVYTLKEMNGIGEGELRCRQILPGIYLAFNKLQMESCYQKMQCPKGILQINHCKDGCFECELEDESVYFLGKGELVICLPDQCRFTTSRLPLGYYEGLTVMIDLSRAGDSVQHIFPKGNINLHYIFQQIQNNKGISLIRAREEIEHIFKELYSVNEKIREPYSILKVLELLLFLQTDVIGQYEPLIKFSSYVVGQTKKVYNHIMMNPFKRINVSQVAKEFNLAETNLRQCFKSMYGLPIASYLRVVRMEYAAELLMYNKELSVGEIAYKVGYQNQSKFAKVFKKHMHKTPLAYREHFDLKIKDKVNMG